MRACEDETLVRQRCVGDCLRDHGGKYWDEMRQTRHSQEAGNAVETTSEVLEVGGPSQDWWGRIMERLGIPRCGLSRVR